MSNYLFYIGCGMILCAIGGAILLRWYLVTYTNRLMLCLNEMLVGKDRLEIQADCSSRLAGIFDKKWMMEALGNILNNAIKYTRPGGKVSVIADTTDFFVRIRIADTGKGIPEEHYTSIFKRFYREEDVQQEEGAGIGLFLAQEIIRKQSGYIDVKSQPGRGSGKSTLLNMLDGLDVPTSGSVMIRDREIGKMKDEQLCVFRRRNIGFIFQDYNLVSILNAYQNIVLPIELDGSQVDKEHLNEIIRLSAIYSGSPF